MKKIYLSLTTILVVMLSGCGGGGGGGSSSAPAPTPANVLTNYPESGTYVGQIQSSNSGDHTSFKGNGGAELTEDGGVFAFNTDIGQITITGSFQLNNSVCFEGIENFDPDHPLVSVPVTFTNCIDSNNTLTVELSNNFGDTGSITIKKTSL